jgi:hypothetical protein
MPSLPTTMFVAIVHALRWFREVSHLSVLFNDLDTVVGGTNFVGTWKGAGFIIVCLLSSLMLL